MIYFPICPLFVPANRLDWIEKGESSNADGLVLDLEDSIPTKEKSQTREALADYLSSKKIPCVYLQNAGLGNAINPLISIATKKFTPSQCY